MSFASVGSAAALLENAPGLARGLTGAGGLAGAAGSLVGAGELVRKASGLLDKNGGRRHHHHNHHAGVDGMAGIAMDHLSGAASQVGDFARSVPGGSFLMTEAEKLWNSDVPGGFQVGRSVDISLSSVPGVEGFELTSIPDGAELFIGENSHCCHCLCCWMGKGPEYHVIKGNLLEGRTVLAMHAYRSCFCFSPEIDVFSPNGEEVATVDEHGGLCCAYSRVDVRGEERYKIRGHLCGTCCCCGQAASHDIRSMHNRKVGKIIHSSDFMHIEFPQDARASDKAGILAAALLTELRTVGVTCASFKS